MTDKIIIAEQYTDITTHHIEGKLNDVHIKIPIVSHIVDNLYTGGCPTDGPRAELPSYFKYVVSLYPWEKYHLPPGCSRVEVQMYDAGVMPDETLVYGLGDLVSKFIGAGPTLVHCQAGLNRSGLIAVSALRNLGYTSRQAIDLLREKRNAMVLCNQTFENWLLGLDNE